MRILSCPICWEKECDCPPINSNKIDQLKHENEQLRSKVEKLESEIKTLKYMAKITFNIK